MPSGQGIRAGAAYIELFVKDNRLVRGLRAAQQRLTTFGAGVRTLGTQFLAFGAGLAAPIVGSLKLFTSMGDALATMSARTGIAVETLSELGYAADQSGANLEVLEASVRRMQRFLTEAAQGSDSAEEALGRLGLKAKQLRGLAPDEKFRRIADRIAAIEDPTKRAAMAMEIFGRSGTQLLPMMAGGAAGIRELEAQARKLGLTISNDDAQAAEVFGDRLDDLVKVLKRAVFAIGSALAPLVTDLAEGITRISQTISEWIKRNKTLFVTVFKIASAAVAMGAALIVLGAMIAGVGAAFGAVATVISGVGSAIGLIGTALSAILSPIGLVITGFAGLVTYILTSTEAGAGALRWLGGVFSALKETAIKAFQGIGDALAAGDIALAGRILWLSLKLEWQQGIGWLNKQWQAWKAFFLNVANEAVHGLAGFFIDAFAGIQVAWLEMTHFLMDAWASFASGVKSTWSSATDWIAARTLEAQGLIDSEFDVEGAKEQLGQMGRERERKLERERAQEIMQREQQRATKREGIERERTGTRDQLEQMRGNEERNINKAQVEALAASKEALQQARKEWQAAIDEAARKRAGVKADDPGGLPDLLRKLQQQLPDLDGLDEVSKKTVDVVGTFNPLAAARLARPEATEQKQLKALERIDQNMGRMLREAQHGGLVFA